MQIKVIDDDVLEKRTACWGFCSLNEAVFEVLAIKQYHRKKQYLVEYDNRLFWWDEDLFFIVNDNIPKEWVEIRYKYFNKLRNSNYCFKIPISYYLGPKCFMENENFMFDIYENPRDAYAFYYGETKRETGDV